MQQLLVPIRILVDPRERELIFEEEENFTKAGFEIDRFSDNEILIRAVPMLDLRDSIENIFREILKNIKENRNIDIRESILISMSCKGAIKANEKLNHEEMERIVRELHEIGEYTCPHGRPIITKITTVPTNKCLGEPKSAAPAPPAKYFTPTGSNDSPIEITTRLVTIGGNNFLRGLIKNPKIISKIAPIKDAPIIALYP